MTNKTYDILKPIAQMWLPATVALVEALTQIWNIPYGHQIAMTLAAINTFLGAGLGISSKNYYANTESNG